MITRLICLFFAVAIVSVGLIEQSIALMALAGAIVTVVFVRVDDGEGPTVTRPWLQLVRTESWRLPAFTPAALAAGGLALGLSFLSIALVSPTVFDPFSATAWFVAIGATVAFGLLMDRISFAEIRAAVRAGLHRDHRPEIGSVLAITLVAFVLRIYQLETIPMMFHGDEGIVGQMVLKVLAGQLPPLFAVDAVWPQAYLYTYIEAASMWLFGASVFGLRLVGVVFGALGVPIVYAIGRIGWGPGPGAIAAWLFAVSHLQNHYSRIGTFVIESVPLMALVMLCLGLAYERGRHREGEGAAVESGAGRRGIWTLMLLGGLTCGFAQYFYYGSRVIPIVAAPLLLLLWRRGCISVWHAFGFGFGVLIVFAPLGAHFLEFPARFSGRLTEVSIFQDSYAKQILGEGATLPSALPALLAEQTRRSLNLFVRGGDQGGFYSGNTPNFDVITAALVWLGLGAALARPWRYHEASLLLWFWIGLLFSSILTLGAHSGQRVLIMTTAGFLFGSVLLGRVWDLLRAMPSQRVSWLAVPVGTTLALWLLSANVATYFFEYVPRAELAEQAEAAREVVKHADRYHIYFLTEPHYDPNHGAIQFIARGREMTSLRRADDLQLPRKDGRGLMVFAANNHLDDLRAIQRRFPNGEERPVAAPNGRVLFITYAVPPDRLP